SKRDWSSDVCSSDLTYTCWTLLYTHFHSLHIGWRINRFLSIKASCSCIIPCQHTETSLICRFINCLHIIYIIHCPMICLASSDVNKYGILKTSYTSANVSRFAVPATTNSIAPV